MKNVAVVSDGRLVDDSRPLPPSLPPKILDRLTREGISTSEGWHALGPRRKLIFGITASMVREIDAAVRQVMSSA